MFNNAITHLSDLIDSDSKELIPELKKFIHECHYPEEDQNEDKRLARKAAHLLLEFYVETRTIGDYLAQEHSVEEWVLYSSLNLNASDHSADEWHKYSEQIYAVAQKLLIASEYGFKEE